jgi:hypothetical protein
MIENLFKIKQILLVCQFTRLETARTGTRAGLMSRGGTTGRLMTGQLEGNRPMTAVRGAGYTTSSGGRSAGQMFDPLNQGSKSATPSIELKPEDT